MIARRGQLAREARLLSHYAALNDHHELLACRFNALARVPKLGIPFGSRAAAQGYSEATSRDPTKLY